eukprot:1403913-Rhodomonas_salina.1
MRETSASSCASATLRRTSSLASRASLHASLTAGWCSPSALTPRFSAEFSSDTPLSAARSPPTSESESSPIT